MKKKLLLTLLVVMSLVCLFAISVNAEDTIVKSTSDEYGELTTFETAIGYTEISQNKNDGTIARTVLSDGSGNYYTVPTTYILTKSGTHAGMFNLNFTAISEKLGFTVSKASIIRSEMPADITYICNVNTESYAGCANVKEIIISDGLRVWDNSDQRKVFNGCSSLVEIDISKMVLTGTKNTSSMFEKCYALEKVILPDAYESNGAPIAYAINYMFNECTSLTTIENFDGFAKGVTSIGQQAFQKCSKLENISLPTTITSIGNYAFKSCTGLKTITYTGAPAQEYAAFLPEGITSIGQEALYGCTTFKYLSLPSTITYVGPAAFHSCTALEFVDFNDNQNDVDFNNWGAFMNCTNLKAMSLPTNTDVITNRFFSKCTNLQAVYLPSATVTIESNGYGEGTSFYNCYQLYFVNEPFEVRDENGKFYGDEFAMPTRPAVYYFPSNLTNLFNRDTGIGFASCYNLNPTMVMPTTLERFWINDGVFYECGKNGNEFTVVFLGNMTDLRIGMRENRPKGVSYVFANENDIDLSCVNVVDTSPGYSPNLNGDEFVYFCKSNKGFKLFNLGGGDGDSQYTEDNTTLVEMNQHLISPRATETTDATCTKNAGTYYYCFCGVGMGSEEQEGTMLGHEQGELVSRYFPAIVGGDGSLNYFVDMITEHDCTRCDDTIKGTEPNTALFVADGYSIPEKDDSTCISHTIKVNKTNVANYEALTGDKVDYGVVAGTSTSLSAPVVINNGEIEADTYALVGDMTGTEYTKLVIKVTGLETGDQISCNAYIVFNKDSEKIYYLCGDTVTKTALAKSL